MFHTSAVRLLPLAVPMTGQNYPLATVLNAHEADQLARQVAFLRTPSRSGKGVLASFVSSEDRQRAEQLIAAWRSER